jgi:hypothetical protein
MPNFIESLLERRPSVGLYASAGGNLLGWFLAHLGQVTAVMGLFSALFGLAVGYLTFRIQLRKWLNIRKSK